MYSLLNFHGVGSRTNPLEMSDIVFLVGFPYCLVHLVQPEEAA
jgi:hypothetical protein